VVPGGGVVQPVQVGGPWLLGDEHVPRGAFRHIAVLGDGVVPLGRRRGVEVVPGGGVVQPVQVRGREDLRPDAGVDLGRAGAELVGHREQIDQSEEELDLEQGLLPRLDPQETAVAPGPPQLVDVPAEQVGQILVGVLRPGQEERGETVRARAGEIDEADDRMDVAQPVVGSARPAVPEVLREGAVDRVVPLP
jgi:hypothetical protein